MRKSAAVENESGFLSRTGAVVVAFASVVGSGVVVVPAAVLAGSGSAAVLVWVSTALLCVPMIMLFRDTVLRSGGAADPLRHSVHRGLGPTAGRMIPLCFVLVVVVGLPTSAVAGAHLLAAVVPLPFPPVALAVVVLGIAVAANLVGGRASAQVQAWGAGALVAVLMVAAAVAAQHPAHDLRLVPEAAGLWAVPSGMLIAFWAVVGFENLTFVARDMRNPRRDFGFVSVIALILLVGLAILLTVVTSLRLATADPVTGVIDAVQAGIGGQILAPIVAGVGAGGVLLNALAWVRGCAMVLQGASREGIILPGRLVSPGEAPRRAIWVLSVCFVLTLMVLSLWPERVVDLLAAASAVFVLIYVMCILAYLRLRPPLGWALANVLVLAVMMLMLLGSGVRSVYGVCVLLVAAVVAGPVFRKRNPADPEPRCRPRAVP
ncbi:APC family permease [Galactobacter caseinivorans]|nr:amino acid permease [Galactobacter caseinivorans]